MRAFLPLVLLLGAVTVAGGCISSRRGSRPSVLLVVLDTTRVDAVSAYGGPAGVTPNTDAVATAGIRYTRAYAQAPWTLPSHVSLFTGLIPARHGVGWYATRASGALETLAERLNNAGYETVAISENPWVSETFNVTQGFERVSVTGGFALDAAEAEEPIEDSETLRALGAWIDGRREAKPFFLFVNLLDAHIPYRVRPVNRFLPSSVDRERAAGVSQDLGDYMCVARPHTPEMEVLRGLYLGGVAAADAKLGAILDRMRAAGLADGLVVIVTSDHGEHFGEHHLVGHQFSVREELLHVPLVVQGLGERSGVAIDAPVRLTDLMPTILAATGVPVPGDIDGLPLPTRVGSEGVGVVIAEQDDSEAAHSGADPELARMIRNANRDARRRCTPRAPVFGTIRALIRYPLKLIWYERYPAELYDLANDPAEQIDLAGGQPETVAALSAALSSRLGRPVTGTNEPAVRAQATLAPDVRDRLRALGYLANEGEGAAVTPAAPAASTEASTFRPLRP